MKYFTKYIPVEGMPQRGDTVKHIVNGAISICEHDFCAGIKLKLFLCSRDIKIDDRYYLEDGDGVVGSMILDKKLSEIIRKNAYRIIGELSHDALKYVKEGMEYEEKDVHFQGYHEHILLVEVDTIEEYLTHGYIEAHPETIIKCTIKCPTCKHFH